jgi:PAS domain S-box-containing protein
VVALAGACAFLGVALVSRATNGVAEHALLIVWVAALVGLRTLANQRAMTLTHRQLQGALRERQRAVESMRAAMAGLQESDQRLRGLLEAALDGVVEIGPGGDVVRANDAFRTMVGLPSEQLVGRTWTEVAAMTGAEPEMLALRTTGHALIEPDGRPVHLEARISSVPIDPPGTLMLVRDVTASKVAEQTIRTLFQFLQDRDEDRTRYMRRTSLAIEAERNKIARDLHDGPIQGVAAASLSLEAVRLMVQSGQYGRAEEMLASVREELRGETENLRRLMSDLRPPLLDERGLVPAVKEMCARFAETTGIAVHVRAMGTEVVPSEVDTVAYRVIQEALSNVKKHARARSVVVRIEAAKGTLDVEVEDDGEGFDASEAREYLRGGKVGLASMRERTELGSGTFTLRSRPGAGTTVTASLPLSADPART